MVYAFLFAIVFCETGLVFLPILPGDTLLFAAGALSGSDGLNLGLLFPLFIVAAFCGDNVNYWVGRKFGRKLFSREDSKFFKKSNLEKTEHFFEKHGPKAVIIARFVPIVRTFAPFVSGMGHMHYARFLTYSVIGAVLWVGLGVMAGHLFGGIPFVKKNFELVVLAIVVLSLLPVLIEYLNHRKAAKAESSQKPDA
jgi:membrane-associated protein